VLLEQGALIIHFEAAIVFNNDICRVSVCLWTPGHSVPINIYEEIKQNLEISDIEQVKTRIGLADNATILQSDKTIRLNLLIHSRDGSR
jgi:hypothetical protein